jgi:hypothetical protein
MILTKDVPRLGALPPLRIYKCQESEVPLTETVADVTLNWKHALAA